MENKNPYPAYKEARKTGYTIDKNGNYNFYCYEQVYEIIKNPLYGREIVSRKNDVYYSFLDSDDPYHLRLRRVVSPFFSPSYLKQYDETIKFFVEEKINLYKKFQTIDLISDFVGQMPFEIISKIIGAPKIKDDNIAEISAAATNALDLDYVNENEFIEIVQKHNWATDYLASFMSEVLEYKRKRKDNDLASFLIHSSDLSHGEILTFCLLLYIAGFETTTNMIGNSIYHLLSNEKEKLSVINNGMQTTNVEELLRYDTSIHRVLRKVKQDTEIKVKENTVKLLKNQKVFAHVASANRDENIFSNPDILDFKRTNSNENLSFSAGTHFCIGSFLAKQEIKISVEKLFQAFPQMSLTDDYMWKSSKTFRGLKKMVVSLN